MLTFIPDEIIHQASIHKYMYGIAHAQTQVDAHEQSTCEWELTAFE